MSSKDYKIKNIEIIPIKIELNDPFVISAGAISHAMNTVVIIHTAGGVFGTGECSRFRSIYAETQLGLVDAGKLIAQVLIGKDVRELRSCIRLMDKTFVGYCSIKSAFDMALYDLNSKLLNVPLYRYLGGDKSKTMHTDMTISFLDKKQMVKKAREYAKQGFPALKIKLGDRPAEKDIERMAAIRKAVGPKMPLRVDANQGWNYYEANKALHGMAEYDIEHCEAPIPAQNFIDLRKLNAESPIPIMGDESIYNHHDAYRMLAEDCMTLLNIKLGKSGGICHAMKIAAIAQAAGVYCQVGCFSETRLAISALAHFTLAWDNIIYYDMDSPLMQSEDPIKGGLKYGKNWEVTVTDKPGHGAEYDKSFLKKFDKVNIS